MSIWAMQYACNKHATNIETRVPSSRPICNIRLTLGSLLGASAFVLFALAASCLALQREVSGPAGGESRLNVSFMKPGVTTRAEVMQKLGWADTQVTEDDLFVARWVSSSQSSGAATGDDEVPDAVTRTWHAHNLIVEFDSRGVVAQFRDVPDKRLAQALSEWIVRNRTAPLDLRVPITIPVLYRGQTASLLLTPDAFEFRSASKGCRVSPSDVKKISLRTRFSTPQPSTEDEAIYFTEKTAAGKKVILQTDVAHLFTLLQYVNQTRLPMEGS